MPSGQHVRSLVPVSAGGHLAEMLLLLPRIAETDSTLFISYDVAQVRSSLPKSALLFAHHPTTKNVRNAVRNYQLARRVFADHAIDKVISTGAGIAVPFMIRARQLGIPCHYIESATRVDGASLSGRMLQRFGGVRLYRQLGDWGQPRWRQGPCVFDGFSVAPADARPVKRAVISLGTHGYPFTSLVQRLAGFMPGSEIEILWQLGNTPNPGGLPGRAVDMLPSDELAAAIADADVVIGHAGAGLTLTALRAGKAPVVVPRRRSRREHTDNHQVQLARELSDRGIAISAEVDELTAEHFERAARLTVTYAKPKPFELID